MTFTRRETLAIGGAALAVAALPAKLMASTADLIAGVTGGAAASSDGIELTAPEIAENGNTVPVAVNAPGAVAITLLAGGNPTPGVAKFSFGAGSAEQSASTRIRLAGQELLHLLYFQLYLLLLQQQLMQQKQTQFPNS